VLCLQVNTQNSSLTASVNERQQQVDDLKQRLEATATDLKKQTEISQQQHADMNSLQQRFTEMKTLQQSTEQKLHDTEATVTKLKVLQAFRCLVFHVMLLASVIVHYIFFQVLRSSV
jgi:Lon protease-like protein